MARHGRRHRHGHDGRHAASGLVPAAPAPPDSSASMSPSLQIALIEAEIPLKVVPGVEIKIGPHVAQELRDGEIGTLGDARPLGAGGAAL